MPLFAQPFPFVRPAWLLLTWLLLPGAALAQIGGRQSFAFLLLPANARTTALGGVNLTADHRDPSGFLANPGLSADTAHAHVSLGLAGLNVGATYSTLTGLLRRGPQARLGLGLQYLSYGQFAGYDATGAPTGSFNAHDYALTFHYSHTLAPFTLGANLKLAGSNLGGFTATALLLDLGGTFVHPRRDLRVGLAIKNLGAALSNYLPSTDLALPFDVQLGVSFKPERMPLRFSFTAHQLAPPGNIAYNDPALDRQLDNNGNLVSRQISWTDRLSRHLVLGGEFLVHPNFNLRLGYNFLQRRELSLPQRRALSGFALGFMLKIRTFEISYSYNVRHVAGGLSWLGLSFDPRTLAKRRKTVK
ncbi:MAG: type IX secretion system protein PorQ [Bernardetiaceae bacterium]|jgi:hypothetical protein|nr:type IX secretion system protein PorQ [Bernardetiaceae bacterium]